MAFLYKDYGSSSAYKDHKTYGHNMDFQSALQTSTTLYIGNLSFYTTEEQIYELFSKCGEIKRIIMGLDKVKKTPCGFCFVEYYTHEDAADCVKYINGTRLDDRIIRTDWDVGFKDGRQYGRGKTGGQVRDEYRIDYDPGRGGYGKQTEVVEKESGTWRDKLDGNETKKRERPEDVVPSILQKRQKESEEDKNPRFRERDDKDSDEDE